MTVFQAADFDDHREVRFFNDRGSGLQAIIAVHRPGPAGVAGGGVRMKAYADEDQALADVLRLSRAMSYKFALAGLPFGGGKTVVIGDPGSKKTPDLLRALGRAVDSFGGRYMCGPDVGTTPDDMVHIASTTAHARGRPGESGDTSPATGYGIYHAIRAAVRHRLNRDDLVDTSVAVQGCGAVGRALCRHLYDAGAKIFVNDLDGDAVAAAVADFEAVAVSSDEIMQLEVDVLAPCALGAVLNDDSIPAIRAAIVCGGANNQLAEERHAGALADAGVLYVPDYVANAGGAINATREGPDYDEAAALAATAKIYDTCMRIFQRAEQDGIPPSVAADRIAAEIIERN
jgi:leucine dehydrogenase